MIKYCQFIINFSCLLFCKDSSNIELSIKCKIKTIIKSNNSWIWILLKVAHNHDLPLRFVFGYSSKSRALRLLWVIFGFELFKRWIKNNLRVFIALKNLDKKTSLLFKKCGTNVIWDDFSFFSNRFWVI